MKSTLSLLIVRIVPPAELLANMDIVRWYNVLGGLELRRNNALRARYKETEAWQSDQLVLRAFGDRLREEHQRVEAIENKARSILFAASLLVGLSSLIGSIKLDAVPHRGVLVGVTTAAVMYLTSAVLLALWAGRIEIRYYIDPPDLESAKKLIGQPTAEPGRILAAVSLASKDDMQLTTEKKRMMVEIAFRTVQNGVVCAVISALWRLWLLVF